jgi:hypothetical protein
MALLSRSKLIPRAARNRGNCRKCFTTLADRFYNEEQKELNKTTLKIVEAEINPYADQVR